MPRGSEVAGMWPGKPLVPSLMVEFRKRLDLEEILQIIDETEDDGHGTPGTFALASQACEYAVFSAIDGMLLKIISYWGC